MGHPTGHKRGGTKLKNHKLRPAPAPADAASSKSKGKAKAAVEEDRAKDDSGYGEGPAEGAEEGEEEGEELRKEMRKEDRPLLGCVISISGIPDAEKVTCSAISQPTSELTDWSADAAANVRRGARG